MARTAFTNRRVSKRDSKTSDSESSPLTGSGVSAKKYSISVRAPKITEPAEDTERKAKRSTNMVLKEIQYYQKTSNMLMSKGPFVRIVRGIVNRLALGSGDVPTRFTHSSLDALQEAFEAFVVSLFENSYCCTIHAKRVTLYPSDVRLARKLKK